MKNLFALPRPHLSLPQSRKVALTASLASLLTFGLLTLGPGLAQAAPQKAVDRETLVRLPGHLIPKALRGAALVGRKSSADIVPLALTLPLRDPAGLDQLLSEQYTPGSPLFHQFIEPSEFTRRFSPSQQTYSAVVAFARSKGFAITGTYSNRLLLEISGPSSAVEAAFRVRLQNYAAPDGRVFHAPDAEPSIPAALAGKISGVVGLQNSTILHTHLSHPSYSFMPSEIGTGPYSGLAPTDIKAAYNLDKTSLTGSGQTLALLELDGYSASDIKSYETAYQLPQVPLQNFMLLGASGVPGNGAEEVTLDIELMAALAPGANAILVYEAPDTNAGELAAFAQIASDNTAKNISTSWGIAEDETDSTTIDAENVSFKQMAAQGQSIYAAAGDSGAYDDGYFGDGVTRTVDDPASQTYVTGVGGTSLNVVSPGGAYEAESTWSDPTPDDRSPNGSGGGGGISAVTTIPSYQQTFTPKADAYYSKTMRNVPDVSLDADPNNSGYSIFFGGSWTIDGGTSCAAPLWAAFTALVNQQLLINEQGTADQGTPLGFPNPALYTTASEAGTSAGFHDIDDLSTNLFYPATKGYDNATGLGSFNGANLLNILAPTAVVGANPISSLTFTPSSVVGGLTSQGTVTLANPAPTGGAVVILSSAASAVVVPTGVTVLAGATSATFTATTTAVTASVAVNVTASYSTGVQTASLTVLPAPAADTPASVTLNPSSVGNGASSVATVTLTGPAPTGGLTVTLSSSDPNATVPASVVVPAGAVSAQFTITTVPVTANVSAVITASLNGGTATATLLISAPALERIDLAPSTVIGGDTPVATLTLTFPALGDGAVVTLTSDNAAAIIPATVTIPAGQTSVTVPITTTRVQTTTAVNIIAVYDGATQKAVLTVKAALLVGLSLAPPSVVGGAPTVGTLTLSAPAPAAGITATLTSSDPAAQVPATLFVPPGALSVSFAIPTVLVQATVAATLTATINNTPQSAVLTILPVQMTALGLTPASVQTGSPASGTVTLNAPAPAGGLTVTLTSSTVAATVPATLVIPAGASTATFTIATPHAGTSVITAVLGAATKTANLTVTASPGTSYPAGLNMISAPYDYAGTSLDTLFGYTGVVLATWQPSTAAYVLNPTAPADTMHIGHGYWINLPTALSLTSVGTPADTTQAFTIALQPGWNMIGDPFTTTLTLGSISVSSSTANVPFDQATTSTPLLVSSLVYRYAPKSATKAGSYVWVRDTDTIQPGLGYWIYAYQAVTLSIPHP